MILNFLFPAHFQSKFPSQKEENFYQFNFHPKFILN